MSLWCLIGHDWEETEVGDAAVYENGTTLTGLKHRTLECSRCGSVKDEIMTPGQLRQARGQD